MKNSSLSACAFASLALTSSALAGWSHSQTFQDATNDLFDNGMANLDIQSVTIRQTEVPNGMSLTMSITTRGFADWTKYMVFIDFGVASDRTDNPWNRPVSTNGQSFDTFFGAWVDGSGGNQLWHGGATGWSLTSAMPQFVSASTNTLTIDLGTFAGFNGHTILFDVATSGGGNDPGVDHLSRSDMATSGWGTGSTSGTFMSYTMVPAPGVVALLGLAGLVSRRRR